MHGKFGQFDDTFWRGTLDAVVPYNQQLNRKTVPQQPVSASDHVCLILSDQKSFLNNLTSVPSYWTGTSPSTIPHWRLSAKQTFLLFLNFCLICKVDHVNRGHRVLSASGVFSITRYMREWIPDPLNRYLIQN